MSLWATSKSAGQTEITMSEHCKLTRQIAEDVWGTTYPDLYPHAIDAKLRPVLEAIRTNAMAHGNAETQLEIIARIVDEAL